MNDPLPPPVGVPVMAPVLALKLSPAGSVVGVTDHVNGPVPPVSLSVALYAVPAVAAVRVVVETAGGGLTLICKVAVFEASVIEVAVTVAVKPVVTEAGAL